MFTSSIIFIYLKIMKNLTLIRFSIFLSLITSAFIPPINAALLTDINGSYIDLGDEGSVSGGGLTLLWDMPRFFENDRILFYINSSYGYDKKDKDTPSEKVLTYVPLSAGFEFRYQIFQLPLYLTGSAGGGISYFKKEAPFELLPSYTKIDSTFGPYADFMIGFNYVFTQNAAIFVKTGYQKSFYNDDSITSPSGLLFTGGIRIPIFDSSRSLGGVDNVYEDSGPIKFTPAKKNVRSKTMYGFLPGVIIPFGKFGDISDFGPGGMFTFTRTNFFFRNFEAGISPGFYYMHKKDKDYQRMMIAPVYLTAGYRIVIADGLSIKPVISPGGAYVDEKYLDRKKPLPDQDSRLITFEPTGKAGIFSEYIITNNLKLTIACEYGAIIEKNRILHFAVANAGVNYSF